MDDHRSVKLEDLTAAHQMHVDHVTHPLRHDVTMHQNMHVQTMHQDVISTRHLHVVTGSNNPMHQNTLTTIGQHTVGSISDDLSEPSSPDSTTFDDSSEMLTNTPLTSSIHEDTLTAQLAAAGPIGMAAAAAIQTGKKKKKDFAFETNPSIRKRQATRLLRKLKALLSEFTTRVGQQACIVVCSPGKSGPSFKCFGAAPLENILKARKNGIMDDLDSALAQQAPVMQDQNPDVHELPPLVIEGIPTPVDKMTQAQLRAFIPVMLKYSTGRGKPGWNREQTRPPWWPEDVPWANVRSDVRTEEGKKMASWTNALRRVVKNCYQYHGREELLDPFSMYENNMPEQAAAPMFTPQYPHLVHTINNVDGTISIIQVDAAGAVSTLADATPHTESTNSVSTLVEAAASAHTNQQSQGVGGGGLMFGTTMESLQRHHDQQAGGGAHDGQIHTSQGPHENMVEATIRNGQLILSEHPNPSLSATHALVGLHGGTTGEHPIVSIPVQAAAAMMQIQGGNLVPVSLGTNVQFLSASQLPAHFQLTTSAQVQSERPSSPQSNGMQQQQQSGDVTPSMAMHDHVSLHLNQVQVCSTDQVPSATQAVEVASSFDELTKRES